MEDASTRQTTRFICEECGSRDISITPVPGLWIQCWCNSCDHWWWINPDGTRTIKTS